MQPDQMSQPGAGYQPESKPAKSVNVLGIVMTLLTILFLCVSVGVGYWAYTLNTKLTALQGEYDSLTAENATLNSNVENLTADLNTTKTDLEKTQADLATEKELSASQREKMDKVAKLVEVAIAIWVKDGTFAEVGEVVIAAGDDRLKELWDAYDADRNSNKKFNAFEDYLYETMAELLK